MEIQDQIKDRKWSESSIPPQKTRASKYESSTGLSWNDQQLDKTRGDYLLHLRLENCHPAFTVKKGQIKRASTTPACARIAGVACVREKKNKLIVYRAGKMTSVYGAD
jgi:hypothetical protein